MEYIREVLLRQRAAWQRLVLGGGRMETVPEGAADTRRRTDREIPEGAADRFALSEGVTAAEPDAAGTVPAESGWGEPGWSAGIGTEMGRGTQSWRTLERELARKSAERREAAGADGLTSRRAPSDAGFAGRGAGLGGVRQAERPDGQEFRMLEAELPGRTLEIRRAASGGGADGAKTMSRIFQRDARRYDGGFRLYE